MAEQKPTRKRTRDEKLEGARLDIDREGEYWVIVPFAAKTEGKRLGPVASRWIAAQRLTRRADGSLVVGEVRIYPDETSPVVNGVRDGAIAYPGEWSRQAEAVPPGGVTTAILRAVPIGGHIAAPVVADWLGAVLDGKPDRYGVVLRQWPDAVRNRALELRSHLGMSADPDVAMDGPRRRGRPGHGGEFYRALANDFNRLVLSGVRNPAQRLAAERKVKSSTCRTWVKIARQRGLIPPAPGPGQLPKGALAPRQPVGPRRRRAARPFGARRNR